MKPIGILALQGDFAAHRRAVEDLGMQARLIRLPQDLDGVSGLIIPGGESTTLLKLAGDFGLLEGIKQLHHHGLPLFGTCAGAILLARRVIAPEQPSLGLIDITIERNAWGRQKNSFEATARFADGAGEWTDDPTYPMDLVFIRAPRIRSCDPGVAVLMRLDGEPILVRQGSVIASTFHPEMTRDRRVHAMFCREAAAAAKAATVAANPGLGKGAPAAS